jgi:hypothetical protein
MYYELMKALFNNYKKLHVYSRLVLENNVSIDEQYLNLSNRKKCSISSQAVNYTDNAFCYKTVMNTGDELLTKGFHPYYSLLGSDLLRTLLIG